MGQVSVLRASFRSLIEVLVFIIEGNFFSGGGRGRLRCVLVARTEFCFQSNPANVLKNLPTRIVVLRKMSGSVRFQIIEYFCNQFF